MRVALIQFNATADKQENITRAVGFVTKALAKGSKFVLLPEIFHWRGDPRHPEKFHVAEKIPGPSTAPFILLAKKYQANILLGSILEKTTDPKKMYNTSVLINAQGKVAAKYRKIHLFDARLGDKIVREADCFKAGTKKVMAKVEDFSVGMSICYDLRFADLYQHYARQGANVLVVPSCFMKATGQAHWQALLQARAIENLSYVLAPNQVGLDGQGMPAYGHSMIISPWGEIIAQGSLDKEAIITADITLEKIQEARTKLPSLIEEKKYGKKS